MNNDQKAKFIRDQMNFIKSNEYKHGHETTSPEFMKNIPDKLYRFRRFDEEGYNLDALDKDYIRLSMPKEFDDPSDASFGFDVNMDNVNLKHVLYDKLPLAFFAEMVKKNKFNLKLSHKYLVSNLLSSMKEDKTLYKEGMPTKSFYSHLSRQGIPKFHIEKIQKKVNSIQDKLDDQTDKQIQKIHDNIDNIRNHNYICSLTDKYDNPMLWDLYTKGSFYMNDDGKYVFDKESHAGFCIEYTLKDDKTDGFKKGTEFLSPVIYNNEKESIDMVELLNQALNEMIFNVEDEDYKDKLNNKLQMHIMTKIYNYTGEEEWRFVKYQDGEKKPIVRNYNFPYATAVYLGMNIKPCNKKQILNIAKKKNLEVYQQIFNKFTSKFYYERINILNDDII